MKSFAFLCLTAFVIAGCGRNDDTAATPDAATPADTPATTDTAPGTAAPGATVQLNPTEGNSASGMLTLVAEGDGVRLSGALQGLPPNGQFGFHIHENGDCSAPDASSAGPHFNPANAQHGNPQAGSHHAGDMLNLESDAEGVAHVDNVASGVSLQTGQPHDVLGRAVVLHQSADDYTSQPAGNSGARIACGVIAAPGM